MNNFNTQNQKELNHIISNRQNQVVRLSKTFAFYIKKSASLLALISLLSYGLAAQTGCPDCELTLPDAIQQDTFYLQEFPDGEFRIAYEENVSFRLPTNTSQILYLIPSLPAGIGVGELAIKSINNLPAGLSWESSQGNYKLPEERDGCIKICGTPFEYGLFKLEITVTAKISILTQDATFTRNLYIAPPSSDNSGFSMTNNIGCGNATVSFENNNPSNGKTGYNYQWDFGLGSTTNDENPTVQNYTEVGVYPVSYQAVIDTIGYILTGIEVKEASCDDFLGKPDLKIRITNPQDSIIFENSSIDNLDPPVNFALNLDILEGNYKLEVIDDDSGLGGSDDNCGTINFNQLSNGILEDGDLKVALAIIHPVDTIRVIDSVTVLPKPIMPLVSYDENFLLCDQDSLLLTAIAVDEQIQWYQDSLSIADAIDTTFFVKEAGLYYVETINKSGCITTSESFSFTPTPLPSAPVLKQESNLLSVFNPDIFPADYGLRWFQEDNLLETTYFALCISETGKYAVELTDNSTGCSNYFESFYTYDENGVCTTPTEDLLAKVEAIQIYPNPVQGQLFINLTTNQSLEHGVLKLVNLLGQTLDSRAISNIVGKQQLSFDVSNYPDGVYFVQLQNDADISSWKVLKTGY